MLLRCWQAFEVSDGSHIRHSEPQTTEQEACRDYSAVLIAYYSNSNSVISGCARAMSCTAPEPLLTLTVCIQPTAPNIAPLLKCVRACKS